MNHFGLETTALALVAKGKGLLAADGVFLLYKNDLPLLKLNLANKTGTRTEKCFFLLQESRTSSAA